MGYDDWLDLVSKAGVSVSSIDPAWLQAQFSQSQSPALVAQQIRAGNAPVLVPTVQTTPPQPVYHFTCRACGSHEFAWDMLQAQPAPSNGPAIILCFIITLPLLCIGAAGFIIAAPFWLVAALLMMTNRPKAPRNVRRCRICGWTQH